MGVLAEPKSLLQNANVFASIQTHSASGRFSPQILEGRNYVYPLFALNSGLPSYQVSGKFNLSHERHYPHTPDFAELLVL